jgi:hypothetical protein
MTWAGAAVIQLISRLFGVRGALVSGSLIGAFFQFGCTGGSATAKSAADGLTRRDTKILHEACDISAPGAEKLDANGDKRPDVTIVRAGGREVCRAVDLNFDGTIDVWRYNDDAGRLRRREADYDRDGRIDEITLYKAGTLVEKHRAATLANRLDTWQFFTNGRLVRTERDADGDAVVDQWWEYPSPGCPLIHSDVDGDGRPDPGASIDYCKETGYVPPERQGHQRPTSPSFERPGALPEEVENREEGDQPADTKPAAAPPGGGKKP